MNQIIDKDVEKICVTAVPWDALNNCTLLISGGNSFIMSYLIYALLERNKRYNANITVVLLCRSITNAVKRFRSYIDDSHLILHEQNMLEKISYSGKIDYCIHAASPAGIQSRQDHQAETFIVNAVGCYNLLEFSGKCNAKKFMLVSSVDVYGKIPTEKRLEETDIGTLSILNPRNAYSNGKRAAEALCSVYSAEYGLHSVIVRPFQVYGPGMTLNDGRLHGDFIYQLQQNKKIQLKSNGSSIRSFMYLLDATRAMLMVLFYGASGQAYNVCDESSEASVSQLAEMYTQEAKFDCSVEYILNQRQSIEVKEALPKVTGSADKIKSLGFSPSISLREGVRRTLAYYEL